jgi:hypothetical protein
VPSDATSNRAHQANLGLCQFFPPFPLFPVFPVFLEKLPEHRDCQSHGGAHMVQCHCSMEFQSVWSVRGTVALVSNFLRRIADFGSHLFFTSASSGRRDYRARTEDRLAVEQCELDTQPEPLPARLAIVNCFFPAIGNRADGRRFARAVQAWHQPRAYHWRRWRGQCQSESWQSVSNQMNP